jgi:hypothetical protein
MGRRGHEPLDNEGDLAMTIIDHHADRALKAKHRALWASGDYPA